MGFFINKRYRIQHINLQLKTILTYCYFMDKTRENAQLLENNLEIEQRKKGG